MSDARNEILNLLGLYAERFDAGDFEGAAALFSAASFVVGGRRLDAAAMLKIWRSSVVLYDGSPRTRHHVTNPIIDVDEARGTATCRSSFVVFQEKGGRIEVVCAGRYLDRFARRDDVWGFSERAFRLDLTGDMSGHFTPEALAGLRA